MKTLYKVIFVFLLLFTSYSNSFSQLHGNYTIGIGGNYTTITSAVVALQQQGVNAPTIFSIISGNYYETVFLSTVDGASAMNPIIFKSQSGNPDDVIWQNSIPDLFSILRIFRADFISFQNITFNNSGNYIVGMWFEEHCDNISIIGNKFIGGQNDYGIYSEDALFNNLIIEGNIFSMDIGIKINSSHSDNSTIINNNFDCAFCLTLTNQDNLRLENNRFKSESKTAVPLSTIWCIRLGSCNGNLRVLKNRIFAKCLDPEVQSHGLIIDPFNGNLGLVANNFITVNTGFGMYLAGSNLNIYFNSIYCDSNKSADIRINEESHIISKNNLLVQTGNNGANTLTYNINTFHTDIESDYNTFYNTGSILLAYNSSTFATLLKYQIYTGLDLHSTSVPVNFVSPTDLHLAGSSIGDEQLAGIPSALVTDDIDGQPRDPNYPYKGADEVVDFPLPIELASFTSSVVSNNVHLKWTTSSEINNLGFDVERVDARRETQDVWNKIGFVNGNGPISSSNNYEFTNKSLLPGKYHYRLKQIDFNGNFEYYNLSNEVIIGIPAEYNLSQNYPNPFNPKTVINFSLPNSHYTELKIYDVNGKEVETLLNKVQEAGEYNVEWNASDFSSGIYFYSLTVDGNIIGTKRMILLK